VPESKDFAATLRRERERRGIDLEAVAETTKIGQALLAGLERGDLSRWPSGIFRRAFIRAYAEAIGLPADEVVTQFEFAFPEHRAPAGAGDRVGATDPLRLTLASTPRASARAWMMRGTAAAFDLIAVTAGGALLAWVSQQPYAVTTLAAGGSYFLAGTLLVEASPATWAIRRWSRAKPVVAAQQVLEEPQADEPLAFPAVSEDVEPRRVEVLVPRGAHRDRRHGRPERRRVPRPAQRA
jgi:transcriptional regulator with XRE-family HTH domain